MTARSTAALQAVVAGILFSTGGAAVKATELDAWQVAGMRSFVAAAVLLLAMPAARRWAGGPGRTAGASKQLRADVSERRRRGPSFEDPASLGRRRLEGRRPSLVEVPVNEDERGVARNGGQGRASAAVRRRERALRHENGLSAAEPAWWRVAARRRALLLTLGTGFCYCMTLVLFVHANKRTTAAETIFLQSTAPLFVLLLSPFLLRERPGGRQLLFMPFFGAGLVMAFFGGADVATTAPDPRTGNVLATFCGLAYGLTLIGLRAADRPPVAGRTTGDAVRPSGIAAAACGNVIVCVACLPVMFPLRSVDPGDLAIVVGLGLFQVAFAYVLVTRAARRLQAPVLALLLLLEPALSPFWAMWIHGEQPHLLTWLGGGVVALATVLLATTVRSTDAATGAPAAS